MKRPEEIGFIPLFIDAKTYRQLRVGSVMKGFDKVEDYIRSITPIVTDPNNPEVIDAEFSFKN